MYSMYDCTIAHGTWYLVPSSKCTKCYAKYHYNCWSNDEFQKMRCRYRHKQKGGTEARLGSSKWGLGVPIDIQISSNAYHVCYTLLLLWGLFHHHLYASIRIRMHPYVFMCPRHVSVCNNCVWRGTINPNPAP